MPARQRGLRRIDPEKVRQLFAGLYKGARSPTYVSWRSMIQRTTNPNNTRWADYGGRGVTVCERWRSFDNFLADMGERPAGQTLDRIDNDGNYEPANCRAGRRRKNRRRTRGVGVQNEYTLVSAGRISL